ncbi:hypothetical protein U1Q18_016860 [Sarracenia purpurea var. burkii]
MHTKSLLPLPTTELSRSFLDGDGNIAGVPVAELTSGPELEDEWEVVLSGEGGSVDSEIDAVVPLGILASILVKGSLAGAGGH